MIMVLPLLHLSFCEGISPYSGGYLRIAVDSLRIAMTSINYKDFGLILVLEVKPLKTAAHVFLAFGHELEAEMIHLITCPITGVINSRDRIVLHFHSNEPKFLIGVCHKCIFGSPYKSAFSEISQLELDITVIIRGYWFI